MSGRITLSLIPMMMFIAMPHSIAHDNPTLLDVTQPPRDIQRLLDSIHSGKDVEYAIRQLSETTQAIPYVIHAKKLKEYKAKIDILNSIIATHNSRVRASIGNSIGSIASDWHLDSYLYHIIAARTTGRDLDYAKNMRYLLGDLRKCTLVARSPLTPTSYFGPAFHRLSESQYVYYSSHLESVSLPIPPLPSFVNSRSINDLNKPHRRNVFVVVSDDLDPKSNPHDIEWHDSVVLTACPITITTSHNCLIYSDAPICLLNPRISNSVIISSAGICIVSNLIPKQNQYMAISVTLSSLRLLKSYRHRLSHKVQ